MGRCVSAPVYVRETNRGRRWSDLFERSKILEGLRELVASEV